MSQLCLSYKLHGECKICMDFVNFSIKPNFFSFQTPVKYALSCDALVINIMLVVIKLWISSWHIDFFVIFFVCFLTDTFHCAEEILNCWSSFSLFRDTCTLINRNNVKSKGKYLYVTIFHIRASSLLWPNSVNENFASYCRNIDAAYSYKLYEFVKVQAADLSMFWQMPFPSFEQFVITTRCRC